MTFSVHDLPFASGKSTAGFEPFMAAALAPAMFTSAMMMQGYAFWLSAARGMMPMLNDQAAPLAAGVPGPEVLDVVQTMLNMPVGIDIPETRADEPVFTAEHVGTKPLGLADARDGLGDDLTLISGIGPKIEKKLHELGIFHWDQIAEWTTDEVQWVDGFLDFKGRIGREDWQAQAEALALGGVDEYVKRFGKEPR